MHYFNNLFYVSLRYIKFLLKWLIISTIVGFTGGVFGSVFHICIDLATDLRNHKMWLILLLPVGGVVITAIYKTFSGKGKLDTDRVLKAARNEESVPVIMAPLIFISTCITHLLGGSAGREGAALQLGGSIGYNLGKFVKLGKNDLHIIVMSGMSAVFSALFGTPLTAAFFSLEVSNVGILQYSGLIPCIISSITAFKIAGAFGLPPVRFPNIAIIEALSVSIIVKAIILAVLCAVISILFCVSIKKCEDSFKNLIPNCYLRSAVGGLLIAGLTFVLGSFDYNGAGMNIITDAMNGKAKYEAFLIKIIFTSITIAAGFKGGEIVPSFFIGSTFGCVVAPLIGLSPGVGAAIGFTALFCGVVNCPIAATILAFEVFGSDSILVMATVCGVSYVMSGDFSLYKSQNIVFSKLNDKDLNSL